MFRCCTVFVGKAVSVNWFVIFVRCMFMLRRVFEFCLLCMLGSADKLR